MYYSVSQCEDICPTRGQLEHIYNLYFSKLGWLLCYIEEGGGHIKRGTEVVHDPNNVCKTLMYYTVCSYYTNITSVFFCWRKVISQSLTQHCKSQAKSQVTRICLLQFCLRSLHHCLQYCRCHFPITSAHSYHATGQSSIANHLEECSALMKFSLAKQLNISQITACLLSIYFSLCFLQKN